MLLQRYYFSSNNISYHKKNTGKLHVPRHFFFSTPYSLLSTLYSLLLPSHFRRLLQLLHHREHEDCRDDTEDNQHAPHHHQREPGVPDGADDRSEIVADGCRAKPQAHHQTFELRWRYLRHKRDTHWAKQKLTKCQY